MSMRINIIDLLCDLEYEIWLVTQIDMMDLMKQIAIKFT